MNAGCVPKEERDAAHDSDDEAGIRHGAQLTERVQGGRDKTVYGAIDVAPSIIEAAQPSFPPAWRAVVPPAPPWNDPAGAARWNAPIPCSAQERLGLGRGS